MKFKYDKTVLSTEINHNREMKLGFMAKALQETVILHSYHVGYEIDEMLEGGLAWIAYQYFFEIYRYPEFRENLTITTWTRKSKKFRAYREFEVHSGIEKIAAMSVIGLMVDLKKKKILTSSDEKLSELFQPENDLALDEKKYKWRMNQKCAPEFEIDINTRYSDYDLSDHVNNSVYLEYLETLIYRKFGDVAKIKNVNIQFNKEIDRGVELLQCGLVKTDSSYMYKIYNAETLYAGGEIVLDVPGK